MKRFIGILLISCLVLPFAGSYCWMQYKKHKVKKEIKWRMIAGLNPNELVLLKFTKKDSLSQLKWKHSREFEFKGDMYDIVSKEVHGDTTYYRCWWDHEETKLNKQLQKLVLVAFGQNQENRQQQKNLTDFIKHLFQSQISEWRSKPPAETYSSFLNIFPIYYSPFFSPGSPPPEIV